MASNLSFLFLHALNSLFKTMPIIKRRPAGIKTPLSDFHVKHHKCSFSDLLHMTPHHLSTHSLVFQVEGTLLKSTSLFPYFMLVALEAGGLLRALVLFLAYPFLQLPIWVGFSADEMSLKAMVFLCFFGIKKEGFNIGRTVLPKFFLEDVGVEGLEMVRRMRGRAVGVTDMPSVMVESFLRDYLGIENTVGRELKVVHGYFVGLMEDKKVTNPAALLLDGCFNDKQPMQYYSRVIGLCCANNSVDLEHHFSQCQEVYLVSESEKRKWKTLPRDKYPKPLIFHDGRLAFRPTPVSTLVMFLWLPLGIPIFLARFMSGLLFPHSLTSLILAFTGSRTTVGFTASFSQAPTPGTVYVCNHRTLLDPLYVSLSLRRSTTNNVNVTAVTYSLSRLNEAIAPVQLIRLTRDRDQDAKMMNKAVSRGDHLVVCPEGTTCREPYLLRFSPLFAEMSREIVPVAIDVKVNMFYGTSASGLKCLDPFFHFLNPFPVYNLMFLDKVNGAGGENVTENSSFHVANRVQAEIARTLGFGCTSLTRRDKYMSLAGNDGIVQRK